MEEVTLRDIALAIKEIPLDLKGKLLERLLVEFLIETILKGDYK